MAGKTPNLQKLRTKIVLVLFRSSAKDILTMKRLYTLIALLGLVGMMTGCSPQGGDTKTDAGTNAPAPRVSTNK
jgi:hypothetical protein